MPRARWRVIKPLRDRIAAGHPWVFDRALAPTPNAVTAGDVVTLVDDRGPIATAFADPDSPIRARVLDRADVEIDDRWVIARATAAAARRFRDPLLIGCTGQRLIHGEADGLPGLVVDHYDTTAVIVCDGAAAMAFWRQRLGDIIAGLEAGGATLQHVWLRGDRKARTQGGALRGDAPAEIVIAEDEARFAVDVRAGQKTGFFFDQRENRRTIRRHAAGMSVLNVFAYTGGFSLHAALGGASSVTSVDSASPAIAAIGRNLALSGLAADAQTAIVDDAFDYLARAATRSTQWDLVIVDPPSFARNERARPTALRAYDRLITAALSVTVPGGRFALASCSSHIAEADLLKLAARPGLRLRLSAGAASDHPVLPAFPEGNYLKFLLFDVGD